MIAILACRTYCIAFLDNEIIHLIYTANIPHILCVEWISSIKSLLMKMGGVLQMYHNPVVYSVCAKYLIPAQMSFSFWTERVK